MCGIAGIVRAGSGLGEADEDAVRAMREAMRHRGPDGEGLWRDRRAALGHRRLAVLDPGPAGHQPMILPGPDGTPAGVLVYNGELYNDREIRRRLEPELHTRGRSFRSDCDTETLLWALGIWGTDAARLLRGMYAFAWWEPGPRRLLLARDWLGIKPLHWTDRPGMGAAGVAFASEAHALFACPGVDPRPDWVTVDAYLTTTRPEFGERTMFEGVRTLEPGTLLEIDLAGDTPTFRPVRTGWFEDERELADAGGIGSAVRRSVRLHLRSDVPMCALLSGGLDSSLIVGIASAEAEEPLRTYCAGEPDAGAGDADDFAHARLASRRFGTRHTEVAVDRESFVSRWEDLVCAHGVPLSTPNEVAIYEVCRRLREAGDVVALSGEGADELFGGYDQPLRAALEAHASAELGPEAAGVFEVRANTWMDARVRSRVLRSGPWSRGGGGVELEGWSAARFAEVHAGSPDLGEPAVERRLHEHLRFQREVNLRNLLRRLDLNSMRAGVEGRTPLADAAVAGLADRVPMSAKVRIDRGMGRPAISGTKLVLRSAFRDLVGGRIAERPKRSFPLPFAGWMQAASRVLDGSGFAREVLTDEAMDLIRANAAAHWNIAWPVLNLAMWGRRWWG